MSSIEFQANANNDNEITAGELYYYAQTSVIHPHPAPSPNDQGPWITFRASELQAFVFD